MPITQYDKKIGSLLSSVWVDDRYFAGLMRGEGVDNKIVRATTIRLLVGCKVYWDPSTKERFYRYGSHGLEKGVTEIYMGSIAQTLTEQESCLKGGRLDWEASKVASGVAIHGVAHHIDAVKRGRECVEREQAEAYNDDGVFDFMAFRQTEGERWARNFEARVSEACLRCGKFPVTVAFYEDRWPNDVQDMQVVS